MRFYRLFLIILLTSVACDSIDKEVQLDVQFSQIDYLRVEYGKDNLVSNGAKTLYFDENIFIDFDKVTQKLNIINTTTKSVKTVDFSSVNLKEKENIGSRKVISIITPDSIAVLSDNRFFIINSEGTVILKKRLNYTFNNKEYSLFSYTNNTDVLNSNHNKFFFLVHPDDFITNEDYFDDSHVMELDLLTFETKLIPVSYPQEYKRGLNYGFLSSFHLATNSDNLFILFPLSHSILKYNIESEDVENVNIIPNHTKISSSLTPSLVEIFDDRNTYISNNSFTNLIVDDNLLYVFYREGVDIDLFSQQNTGKKFMLQYNLNNKRIDFDIPEPFKLSDSIVSIPILFNDNHFIVTQTNFQNWDNTFEIVTFKIGEKKPTKKNKADSSRVVFSEVNTFLENTNTPLGDKPHTMVVVLNPGNCGVCLDELASFMQNYASNISSVLINSQHYELAASIKDIRNIIIENNISVIKDEENDFSKSYSASAYPILLFLNEKRVEEIIEFKAANIKQIKSDTDAFFFS